MVMPCSRFGGKPVEQKRIVDPLALRAVAAAVGFERIELVVEQPARVVQQAADQRALAVVDAAAGDEAQQSRDSCSARYAATVAVASSGRAIEVTLALFLFHGRGRIVVDHPACRSDVVATSISAMIFSSVSASDSMAPVSG